jgi:transposase-like protein
MSHSHKLTPHQRERMLSMWHKGASYAEVGRAFGVSKSTVFYWNKKSGKNGKTPYGLEKRPGRSESVRCDLCFTYFRAAPSKKRKYCSRRCAGRHRTLRKEEAAFLKTKGQMPRYGKVRTNVVGWALDKGKRLDWGDHPAIHLPDNYRIYQEVSASLQEIGCKGVLTRQVIVALGSPDQHWTGGSANRRFLIWYEDPLYLLVHNIQGMLVEAVEEADEEDIMRAQRKLVDRLIRKKGK